MNPNPNPFYLPELFMVVATVAYNPPLIYLIGIVTYVFSVAFAMMALAIVVDFKSPWRWIPVAGSVWMSWELASVAADILPVVGTK